MVSLKPVVKPSGEKPLNKENAIVARRVKKAREATEPPIGWKKIGEACGVTAQAACKWQKTGEISREHLRQLELFFKKERGWFEVDPDQTHGVEEEMPHFDNGILPKTRDILDIINNLPPELANEIKRHIVAVSAAWRKGKTGK